MCGGEQLLVGRAAYRPGMVKIELDEAALRKVARDAAKKVATQLDHDLSSYRGKPVDEVRSALERAMRRHGLEPNPKSPDFDRMAEVISDGGHLR